MRIWHQIYLVGLERDKWENYIISQVQILSHNNKSSHTTSTNESCSGSCEWETKQVKTNNGTVLIELAAIARERVCAWQALQGMHTLTGNSQSLVLPAYQPDFWLTLRWKPKEVLALLWLVFQHDNTLCEPWLTASVNSHRSQQVEAEQLEDIRNKTWKHIFFP